MQYWDYCVLCGAHRGSRAGAAVAVALEVVHLEGVNTKNENRRSDDDDGTSDCGNPGNHHHGHEDEGED